MANTIRKVPGIGGGSVWVFPEPIIASRAPGSADDNYEVGQLWVDSVGFDVYHLAGWNSSDPQWVSSGGGSAVFTSITVTTTALIGTGLMVTSGNVTFGSLGLGVVIADSGGLLASTNGTNGQLLVGGTAVAPAWSSVTSGDGSVVIATGPNSIDLTVSGATASTFPTDAGTATPFLGATTIAGGTNINTAGAGSTVTINVDNAPTFSGLVTASIGLSALTGSTLIKSTDNVPDAIHLLASGGVLETITIHADDGTSVDSVNLLSDVGGITLQSVGLATDSAINFEADAGGIDMDAAMQINITSSENAFDAIRINASHASGGIDIDCGLTGFDIDTTGDITLGAAGDSEFVVTGAGQDLVINSLLGSVFLGGGEAAADAVQIAAASGGIDADAVLQINIASSQAAADAIRIFASNAAGGIDVDCGTGGMAFTAANGAIALASGTGTISVGNQATTTTVGVLDVAPTSSRTITIGGGTVVTAAVTDTIDIGPDGATTNANSVKAVNVNTGGVTTGQVLTNIASGTVTSGTHTTSIASGNRVAGTMALNLMTGTGTKTANIGNTDGLTTINIDGETYINNSVNSDTYINTGTSTGTLNLGNAAAGILSATFSSGISLNGGTAGGCNFTSGFESASAIVIEATGVAGGLQIKAGSAGIEIGNEADTAILDIGDVAPTSSRTITVGGGTVVTAAVTDTIDIGPDGATTNANSIKTVNVNTGGVTLGQVLTNIASGTVTSGTHTTSIATGNRVAGAMQLDLFTGTGTKIANLGNADALTTLNIDANTYINDSINGSTFINTGTSTGTVSIGNSLASNINIDSATEISLDTAGDINVTSSQAGASSVIIEASASTGGVDIKCGSGGLSIGNEADTTNIRIGDIAPAVSRDIIIGGGAVTGALVLDNIYLGNGAVSTSATAEKSVWINTGSVALGLLTTNIATGTVTSGIHTTSIASGNRVAGTMQLDLFTGTGTKTANIGNTDALTTLNIDAFTYINEDVNTNTHINTGTSTGSVEIGNVLAGTFLATFSNGISFEGGTAGGCNFTCQQEAANAMILEASGAAGGLQIRAGSAGILIGNEVDTAIIDIGNIAPTSSRTITVGGGLLATAVTDTIDIGVDGASNAGAMREINIGTGNYTSTNQFYANIGTGNMTDAGIHEIRISTGTGTVGNSKSLIIGNVDGLTNITIFSPRESSAGAAHTLNGTRGRITMTGLTTASGATETLTITNSSCTTVTGIQASLTVVGAEDAQMNIKKIRPLAGSFTILAKNDGAAALATNLILTFELYT